ncbi:MAG TPA: hypothetical protein VHT49_00535 [Acidimicrobiales bacterium]|nr:hypothetical protein [Acidimicrobiales bacterium]
MLARHRGGLDAVARALLDEETIDGETVGRLVDTAYGRPVHEHGTRSIPPIFVASQHGPTGSDNADGPTGEGSPADAAANASADAAESNPGSTESEAPAGVSGANDAEAPSQAPSPWPPPPAAGHSPQVPPPWPKNPAPAPGHWPRQAPWPPPPPPPPASR